MMRAEIKFFFKFSNAIRQAPSKLYLLSFSRCSHNGCAIFEKFFMNHLQKPACPRELFTPLMEIGVGSFSIALTVALSTSIPFYQIRFPNTMPSFMIKCHFSQFSTKLQSSHLFSTSVKLSKHQSKESQITDK